MWKAVISLLATELSHMVPAAIGVVPLIGWLVTDQLIA